MDSLWKRSFVLRHHFQASEYILGSLKAKKIIPIPDRSSLSPVKINTKPYNDDASLLYAVYTVCYRLKLFETVHKKYHNRISTCGSTEPVVIQIQIDVSFLMILKT